MEIFSPWAWLSHMCRMLCWPYFNHMKGNKRLYSNKLFLESNSCPDSAPEPEGYKLQSEVNYN